MNKSQPSASVPVNEESVSATSALVLMETESAWSITPILEFLDEGSSSKGTVSSCKKTIIKYFLYDQVTKAEVLWCLRTVMTHSSFRSNSDLA
ncbi:hypothetical protein AVEN_21626-1 [Araneus ventricosus]|uniref:Uncharacterized protein n=1 Tax=Araneus ventricosus TaxID=182803 RepID=A0A4Y2G6H3_ARAVE|nr:hypothetical protein AVEN_21626-1 [Araneus ventricosus]